MLRKTRPGKSRDAIVFEKLRFQNVVHPQKNEKRFQISPVRRTFSNRFIVDGRPNRRNKATFSNFFGEENVALFVLRGEFADI